MYSEKAKKNILQMSDMFYMCKQKYQIFMYINVPEKQHPLKIILCETFFRHTILELYSIFFDHSGGIRKSVIPTFINNISKNNGIYTDKRSISIRNLNSGTSELQVFENELDYSDIINDIKSVKKLLNEYRNKVLAHKDEISTYNITTADLTWLVTISEKIIVALLNVAYPGLSRSFNYIYNDNDITELFRVMSGDIFLSPEQLSLKYPDLV